ncbi:MAG: SUMF1/EgtB/PvdO family nonheme iron enzyme [Phormidium tanganyikae FI6-MK23]|jgi:formylglycine-generating enzyme required for sulfatase activity|nr:SUMF1/EgtB/PvdO family nonheme iron enzyme [Phormidium tanganyikae FI6-MK23]
MTLDDKTTPLLSKIEFERICLDQQGNVSKRDRASALSFNENGIALEMIQIPGGVGQVGSPSTEAGRSDDEDIRTVQLPSFFISKYPITQAQWKAIAGLPQINHPLEPEPACFNSWNRPIESVSWYDAMEFCARLSHLTGRPYRLPSEAEWEYACRAGTTTPFHFGETLSTNWANYCGKDHYGKTRAQQKILYRGVYGKGQMGLDRKETTEVGHFQVGNAFGLYDMHGNVLEWCANGLEEEQQPLRGGSWASSPSGCRAASRWLASPDLQKSFIGFRVVYCSNDDRQTNQPASPTSQTMSVQRQTILFLASSPTNQARLRQDKEIREVNLGLERAKHRERFKLEQRWAVRPVDLRRALLDFEPQILHFSGHGDGGTGLVLEDQSGASKLVSATALASLFHQFADRGLDCVVLNACYSDDQADEIVKYIPYVIGMRFAISDAAAIEFAVGFYDALGAGWSYERAFEIGKSAIVLEGLPEEMTPILRKRIH